MYLHVSHVSELCTCGDRMHLNSIRYTMHLHMQARCKKLMQRFQRYASTYARYLHCICMMQVPYLHCICMGAACICKSHANTKDHLSSWPAGGRAQPNGQTHSLPFRPPGTIINGFFRFRVGASITARAAQNEQT